MGIFEILMKWSEETFIPYGEFGLFAVAFMESSFFPVPPDLLLIPLALMNPTAALWLALVCTAGSVAGALLGHYIGEKGGRPILKKIVPDHKVEKVESYFNRYGAWAIGIAALTPIPYKIFTITSGVMKFKIPKLLIASTIGRGTRFFAEAIVIMLWGKEIISFMGQYFEVATSGIVAVALLTYFGHKKLSSRKK